MTLYAVSHHQHHFILCLSLALITNVTVYTIFGHYHYPLQATLYSSPLEPSPSRPIETLYFASTTTDDLPTSTYHHNENFGLSKLHGLMARHHLGFPLFSSNFFEFFLLLIIFFEPWSSPTVLEYLEKT